MAAPAVAADLPARPYKAAPAPMPYVAPIYDWSGFYIGANGGWGESHSCVDLFNAAGTDFASAVAVIVPEASSAAKSAIAGQSNQFGVRIGGTRRLGRSQQKSRQRVQPGALNSQREN